MGKKVVIIGNGIAGVTAARNIRKLSDYEIHLISGESEHFFSRTALMYVYMGQMKFEHTKPYENQFWKKNRINLIFDWVESVDFTSKKLKLRKEESLAYDYLILATGSKPRILNWPGVDLQGVQGLYSKQDLELLEANTKGIKSAVVVGGGLIGVELVEMLLSRGVKTTFLVRGERFWGNVIPEKSSKLIEKQMRDHGVDLILNDELKSIQSYEGQTVSSIKTKSGKEIRTDFLGVTIGVEANVDFLRSSELAINKGVLVDNKLKTNIKDVFAIGDCVELINPQENRNAIEQVWYTGRMMGETVAQTICGKATEYNPGVWFNSAKFFDIEYQTYGQVPVQLNEHQNEFYWEDESGKRSFHVVFDKEFEAVLGVNAFGIRLRAEIIDAMINEKRSVNYLMKNLKSINFDPEFYTNTGKIILKEFNQKFSKSIKRKKKLLRVFRGE